MSNFTNLETLYVKGMNTEDAEAETEDDIWDDRKLNNAYDKALRMANQEVAQRVAMATNSKNKTGDSQHKKEKHLKQAKSSKQQKKSQSQKSPHKWKEGMPCRAVYHEDGFEYEGIVLSLIDDKECVIRFIGYNNTEIVPIASLQTTLGKEARKRQVEEAMMENNFEEPADSYLLEDNGISDTSSMCRVNRDFTRVVRTPGSDDGIPDKSSGTFENRSATPHNSKSRMPKRRTISRPSLSGDFVLPEMPIPDIAMMRQQYPTDMPIPPPPLIGFNSTRDCRDEEGLAAMLLSWYMSGYHTGYYQGLKRAKSVNGA